jgi:cell fate (sporulation/competence/biofilm development) regulator YmcA (YheA/YmcA/DUF963 family)
MTEARLKQRTMEEVSSSIDRMKAAIAALPLFHRWKDDAAAQEFFKELEAIEGQIQQLCEQIS